MSAMSTFKKQKKHGKAVLFILYANSYLFGFYALAARCALKDDKKADIFRKGGHGYERADVFDLVRGIVLVLCSKRITDIFCASVFVEHADEVLRVFRRALDTDPFATRKSPRKSVVFWIGFKQFV